MSYIDKIKQNKLSDETLDKRVRYPLSDGDLERYFGAGRESEVMKYSELAKFNSIDELLPEPFDFRILLIETKENSGHWVVILKYKDTIEYFNSYGVNADTQKSQLSKAMNYMLGQKENFITNLVKKSNYKYVVNDIPFQSKNSEIATCGRWCALRIITAKDLQLDLVEFAKLILSNCEALNVNPDTLVSMWID
jgi:hypothetical protein